MSNWNSFNSAYSHTQKSPLDDLLFLLAGAAAVGAWSTLHEPPVAWGLLAFSLTMLIVGLCFGRLTVRDEGDVLAIRYGPLPLFKKRIPYGKITVAEAGRSTVVDGWGIHYVPGRGWTYSLWGFNCVVLRLGSQVLRIGSDDVTGLTAFLLMKIGPAATAKSRCRSGETSMS